MVTELAHAFHRQGIPSLRFNWRGVGASTGVPTADWEAALSDYSAALALVRADTDAPSMLCGYSFGAVTALRLAARGVEAARLVLVAPPPALLTDLDGAAISTPVRILVGARDDVAPQEQLARWCERVPDAQLEALPGVDHFFGAGQGLSEVSAFVELALKLDPVVLELDV